MLHRYLKFEAAKETLKGGQLKFSCISLYNDPFELIPATSSDFFSCSPEEIYKKIENIAKTEEGKKIIQEIENTLGIDDFIMGASIVASAITFPYLTAFLASGLFLLNLTGTDENNKIQLLATKYYPIFLTAKCCCFSKVYDNILMWSHYADSHKGIVLSFDTFLDYWEDEFHEMEYSNKRISLPTLETNQNDYVWNMLTSKSLNWSYEQEYRMIRLDRERKFHDDNRIDVPFKAEALKEIRLGLHVKEEQRKDIIDLRDKRYKDAVIYQAKLNKSEYKFDFEKF